MSADTRSPKGEQLEVVCPVSWNEGLDDPAATPIQRNLEHGLSQRRGLKNRSASYCFCYLVIIVKSLISSSVK